MHITHGPRPESKIRPSQLSSYEESGEWLAQRKFNGHKNTFFYDGYEGKVSFFNKGKPFLRYKTPPLFDEQISSLNLASHHYWFDSELLHPRVPNVIVIYDVLQVAGKFLIGMTQEERLKLLASLMGNPTERCDLGVALKVTDNIWLAESWDKDFSEHYKEYIHLDLIEGLVLRKKSAPLDNFGVTAYTTQAQVRCRKETKNYRF